MIWAFCSAKYTKSFYTSPWVSPADSQYWSFYINSAYRKFSFHFRNWFEVSWFWKKLAKCIVLFSNSTFLQQPQVLIFKNKTTNETTLLPCKGMAVLGRGLAWWFLNCLWKARLELNALPFIFQVLNLFYFHFATSSQIKLSNATLYEKYLKHSGKQQLFQLLRKKPNLLLPWDWNVPLHPVNFRSIFESLIK